MEKSYSQNIERLIYYATPGRCLREWPLVAYRCSIEIVAQQNKRRAVLIGVVVDEQKQKGNRHSVVRSEGACGREWGWYV